MHTDCTRYANSLALFHSSLSALLPLVLLVLSVWSGEERKGGQRDGGRKQKGGKVKRTEEEKEETKERKKREGAREGREVQRRDNYIYSTCRCKRYSKYPYT